MEEHCDWRFQVVGLGRPWRLEQRDEFVKLATLHFGLITILPMVDQLREGLKTYQVLQSLKITQLFTYFSRQNNVMNTETALTVLYM